MHTGLSSGNRDLPKKKSFEERAGLTDLKNEVMRYATCGNKMF